MTTIGVILTGIGIFFSLVFISNNYLKYTYYVKSDSNDSGYVVYITDIKDYIDNGVINGNMQYLIDNYDYRIEDFVDDYLSRKDTLQGYIKVSKYFGNDLNEFWQRELGVKSVDNTPLIIILVILLVSTIAVPRIWYSVHIGDISFDWIYKYDWFYIKSYKNFIKPQYQYTYVKIKFKVFQELFKSFSIAETTPWEKIDTELLVLNTHSMPNLNTQNKYYQISFSYLDYLKYLHFLNTRKKYQNAVTVNEANIASKKNTLDFCQDIKVMLRAEGKRPWKDLMK